MESYIQKFTLALQRNGRRKTETLGRSNKAFNAG